MRRLNPKDAVLLVGSVPLGSADEVFHAVSDRLAPFLASVPDGETGERLKWIGWQSQRFRGLEEVEVISEMTIGGPVPQTLAMFRVRTGTSPSDVNLRPLGYADEAQRSFRIFKELKSAGRFEPDTRFQVSIPTATALSVFFPEAMEEFAALLESELVNEVASITRAIPEDELSIQWDVAVETQAEERNRHPEAGPGGPEISLKPALDSLARLVDAVPASAVVGIHLCYGDPDGQHVVQPADLCVPVDIANQIAARATRTIDWIHMPVPVGRTDDSYFAPLDRLHLDPATRVYLGLVHLPDGVDGAQRRIDAAKAHLIDFGIATECGLGRQAPERIGDLLDLHRELASRL